MADAAVLDRALRELAREVEFPPEPDLVAAVARRLRADERPRRLPRRPLAVALAALAAAAVAALAVPQTRAAILDLLGIGGATVERVETLPPAEERGLAVPGRPVSLEQARAAVSFELRVLAGYDAVYLDRGFVGGLVSFVDRGERIVLTQFRGQSTPYIEKSVAQGTRVEAVQADDRFGYWLEGRRHVVVFRDETGRVHERRVAGNVLLWERGEVTYRLEGARTLAQAQEMAATLR